MGSVNKQEREKQKQERLGEISYNTYGSKMTIIFYNSTKDMVVQFDNGYTVQTMYDHFEKGLIKSPYDRTLYNMGYLGEGKYKAYNKSKKTKEYKIWCGMLKRCYDEKHRQKQFTYKDCVVCDEWLNFQTFSQWYRENYYEVEGQRTEIDKDILIKGNKVYSPETCVFVPNNINTLFVKNDTTRGEYPIGVYFYKATGKYNAQCNNGKGKIKGLGTFNTPEEAFNVYKEYKEKLISKTANKYKNQIPECLYNAMINYKVEITD